MRKVEPEALTLDAFGDHFLIKIEKMYLKDPLKINAEKVLKK